MIELLINIDIATVAWKKSFPRLRQKLELAAALAFAQAKKPPAFKKRRFDLNILLTSDSNLKKLNHTYRGKNVPTNVLSFPQINLFEFKKSSLDIFPQKATIPLGDVVLAYQTILKETKEQKKTFESHAVHLVVHGTLHLMGYDHMRVKDAKIMEKLECDILQSLGYSNPYHELQLKTDRRSRHG